MPLPSERSVIAPPEGTAELLHSAGYGGAFTIVPLSGGANNRVYRVDGFNAPLVLKHFFRSPGDTRNRFQSENAFYTYLQTLPVPLHTAKAIAWSETKLLGLFSWIDGQKLTPERVNQSAVDQALQFFIALNPSHRDATWLELPPASESCFTLQTHLECVEKRIRRLENLQPENPLEREASAFVAEKLRPHFEQLKRGVVAAFPTEQKTEWTTAQRCVSPSDFGFHNALSDAAGTLRFFDFEYAGVDDPAKFFCDFLSQPAIPLPQSFWRYSYQVLHQALPELIDPEKIHQLLPLYQLKWCCILLNEFLPVDKDRRHFSNPNGRRNEKQKLQLEKARKSFSALTQLTMDFLT